MSRNKNLIKYMFNIGNIAVLSLTAFICIAPILHVLFMSVSNPGIVKTMSGIMLLPKGPLTLNGYKLIFRNPNIVSGYLNTLFYVGLGTFISAVFTLTAGYVLSIKRFKMRSLLMFLITFTMLFDGGLIPLFLTVNKLGMINTRWAVILPNALGVINIIIMRTAFAGIPESLEESARLDGANEITILIRILIPVVKATFAVIVLFYAVQRWNEWFYASIFLKDRSLYPLQLFLREILLQNRASVLSSSQVMGNSLDLYKPLTNYAMIIIFIIPILCLYPFVQKYFVMGVMIGSVKG